MSEGLSCIQRRRLPGVIIGRNGVRPFFVYPRHCRPQLDCQSLWRELKIG